MQVLREELVQVTGDINDTIRALSTQGQFVGKLSAENMQPDIDIARIEKLHKDVIHEVRERSKAVLGAVDQVRADGWMATVHLDVPQTLRELQSGVQNLSERMTSLSVTSEADRLGCTLPTTDFSEVLTAIEKHRVDISIILASVQELAHVILGDTGTNKNFPDGAMKDNASTQKELRTTKAFSALESSEIDFSPVIDVIREHQGGIASVLQQIMSDIQDFKKGPLILGIPGNAPTQKELEKANAGSTLESREIDFTPVMNLLKEHEGSLASVLQQIMFDIQDVKRDRPMPASIQDNASTQKDFRLTKAFSALDSDEIDFTPVIDVIREHEDGLSSTLEHIMSDMKKIAAQGCPFDISEVLAELQTLRSNFAQFATNKADGDAIISFSETVTDSKSQFSSIISDIRYLRTEINLANSSSKQPKECLVMLQTSIQSQPIDCLPGCANPKLGKHHGKCPNHPDNQEGATVEIHKASGDLNGRRGKLNNYDFANETWNVNVQGSGMKSIKSENLRVCLQELQKLNIGP